MRSLTRLRWLCLCALLFTAAASRAADNVIISEFLARNQVGIVDEDGSREDWIEIFNAGTNTVNLANWALSDNSGNLAKWRFPSTNIGPGRFMLIWASDKNRRVPGAPLHTNFKLEQSPDFLFLTRPDMSIASMFTPYPAQAQDISYGFAVTSVTNVLAAPGAAAKYLVPTDFAQDPFWTDPVYNDSAWNNATTGIGYGFAANLAATDIRAQMSNVSSTVYLRLPFSVADASTINTLSLKMRYNDGFVAYLNGQEVLRRNAPAAALAAEIANSTNDWSLEGAQGINEWFYGYYDRSIDTNDNTYTYTTDFNNLNELWQFDNTNWIHSIGDPAFTMIGRTNWMPNGTNNFAVHWPVRRWVSPISGVVTARVSVAKIATTGGGVTFRVFVNGTQVVTRQLAANDTTGFSTNILVSGLDPGDVIDFALDPTGTDGPHDSGDLCRFFATIDQAANSDPGFDSIATGPADAANATTGETFDLSSYTSFLLTGSNVLSVHGLNVASNDANFLLFPEVAVSTPLVNTNQRVFFSSPTPGAANGLGTTNLGPLIVDVLHTPHEPLSNQVVTVTARAIPTFGVVSGLTLRYRVMHLTPEIPVTMFDDGQHGDGAANDGLFAGTIPANIAKAGEMVRYSITSADNVGRTNRSPSYLTTTSPQYWGYMNKDLSITSALPVLHWFIANPTGANNDTGTRCSIYYNGQFLDNVGVTLHGQSSAGFPKRSHNFNLNRGYKLTIRDEYPAVSDFAMLSTWADRSHFRNLLNTEGYQKAGLPVHYTFMWRVQQNGTFYCVANYMEQGNNEFLERVGLDPDGALYKMYNTFTGAAGNEKKSRKYEPSFDLQALYNAITQPDATARTTYLYDNINIPNMINFLATKSIGSDHDCCHKNYYYYRDSNGSGEWYGIPWDFDLSWGHIWRANPDGNYFNDTIWTNLALSVGNNNTMFALMWNDPIFREMWMRRTRTVTDEILQPAGVTGTSDVYRAQIDFYAGMVRPDAALDRAKWGSQAWVVGATDPLTPRNSTSDFEVEINRLKDFYLPGRRTFLSLPTTMSTFGLPTSQPPAFITIGSVEYRPANSNQAQEYIEIINTNRFAVDISGWKIAGGIDFTFHPGTIITSTNRIFVSPNVKEFRARTVAPRGNQRRMVVGPYKGQLSARGETLALITAGGVTNSSLIYTGAPSAAQQHLRITEIMYSPSPIPGAFNREDYEYVELRNVSTNVTVDLNGVKFAEGIAFNFSGSSITSLSPGQRCLVVRSNAPFTFRYGSGLPVAGVFSGALENNGERLRLLDAFNEEILDFSYNNSWFPITDGLGFSLVVVDEIAEPDLWDDKVQWRPSGQPGGSPGGADPAPIVSAPILVTEVLSATLAPDLDAVELFNPTTNLVDLSGWFLSDNFSIPLKYRIANGTTIQPGGYRVFTEAHFNVGGTNFAFSSFGEEVYLFSGNASGTNLTGYYDGFDFGPGDVGVTFAPYINSMTNLYIVSQASNTLDGPNSLPRVGPIVVSEIMFHPPDQDGQDNDLHEFIELHNISTNPVSLFDTAHPTNRWRLKDAVDYSFTTNVIPPAGYLLVVSFNPATNAPALASFRAFYGLDATVPIVGPFSGKLDNSSDKVELAKPQPPTTNGFDYVLMERITYSDAQPWLAEAADGLGGSIHRILAGQFGNEPTNWIAAAPTPGGPRGGGPLPVITVQPTNAWTLVGNTISIAIQATGEPLRFQWRRNGATLFGATNSTLTLTNAQAAQSGQYDVVVLNGSGMALSDKVQLDIIRPVYFTSQPVSQAGPPGTNATFNAVVAGTPPITYQWRFNGSDIQGATGPSITISNAEIYAHAGFYSVAVQDAVSSAVSAPATFIVAHRPVVTNPPTATTILAGQTARFRVVAGPVHPLLPMTNTWALIGLVGQATNTTMSEFYVLGCTNSGSVRMRVSTSGGQTNITTGLTITVLPDADRDGMADAWEEAHGFATNNLQDASADADGDGMSNRDEYGAGTNPTNALSVLKLAGVPSNEALLQFTAQSNISYTIQFRTNLLNADWQTWMHVPAVSGPPREVPFPARTNDTRFYRVVTPKLD